eukprot:CAMPEP_0175685540 /NCGR_PEP_ID=MMETSP0097-20121207/27411_1 /TAXON_ID=311494 /ORGANISM="Alexandrium monilatum, Strain CCMP3105" /LENGTH=255 /DNA_ID=CAMNT_0016992515 /DNA_START=194 /DNA_END=958 /DNA_ORIENTATION=+
MFQDPSSARSAGTKRLPSQPTRRSGPATGGRIKRVRVTSRGLRAGRIVVAERIPLWRFLGLLTPRAGRVVLDRGRLLRMGVLRRHAPVPTTRHDNVHNADHPSQNASHLAEHAPSLVCLHGPAAHGEEANPNVDHRKAQAVDGKSAELLLHRREEGPDLQETTAKADDDAERALRDPVANLPKVVHVLIVQEDRNTQHRDEHADDCAEALEHHPEVLDPPLPFRWLPRGALARLAKGRVRGHPLFAASRLQPNGP